MARGHVPNSYFYSPPAPRAGQTQIVQFDNAPMRGHSSRPGSSNVALFIPPHFDHSKPATMVLYFHGHGSTEADVVNRDKFARQLAESGINAVLVAPRLGWKSEPGQFANAGYTQRFLEEAAHRLAHLQAGGAYSAEALEHFRRMPVVVTGHSGGYEAAAAVLRESMRDPALGRRVAGTVLFDALYGQQDTFRRFAAQPHRPFVVSTYIPNGQVAERNEAFARQASGNVSVIPVHLGHRPPATRQLAIQEHYVMMENGMMRRALAALPNYVASLRTGPAYAHNAPTPQHGARNNPAV